MSKNSGVELPFHSLVTRALDHLRSAKFSRKARMHPQELHFLKKFEEVAGTSVPSHSLYSEKVGDKSVMEIETQLDEVRKRIKNLEDCLENEASLTDEEWLDSRLGGNEISGLSLSEGSLDTLSNDDFLSGVRAIPVATLNSNVVVGKPRQVRIQESTDGSQMNGSGKEQEVGQSMKSLYKQFLGAGSHEKSIEEFRESLKTLEDLELERKERLADEYTKQKMEEYKQRDSGGKGGKNTETEDLDLLKSFIASGWSLLTAESKKDAAASSSTVVENRTRSRSGREEKRKSPSKSSVLSQSGRSGTEDEGEHVKVFRERWEASKRKETEKNEVNSEVVSLSNDHKAGGKTVDSSELERLRKEMEKRFDSVAADAERWRKQQFQEMERFVKERAGAFLSQQFSATLSEMENQLCSVREEIRNVERSKGGLQKEHDCMRYEAGRMRMELQSARDAAVKSRMDVENLKKESEVKVDECCRRIAKLSQDSAEMRAQIGELKTMEEPLSVQREGIRKIVETLQKDGLASKSDFHSFKEEQEAICGRILIEGEKEKAVIMDRVEHLSQLYLGGLEDVKTEVSNLKVSLDSSSSARSESLFAEMRRRAKKCTQLEAAMKDKFEEVVRLHEKYSSELEKAKAEWHLAVNVQLDDAKAMLGDLAEEKQDQLGSRFESTRLEQTTVFSRIQSVEDRVQQLAGSVQTASSDPLIFGNIEKHQEVIQSELHRLDEQMRDALRRLEQLNGNVDEQRVSGLKNEIDALGQKVRDATKSRTVILDKMGEMGKKIRKLEGAQVEFIRSIEEVRASTSDLERSSATWLPKYESAAVHLKDMDTRLSGVESLIKECGISQIENKESDTPETSSTACVELLHTRVETLEGRVEHVASATITNLRILDSKVEHYRVGVQSAIEGAAMAESKCGVLGAELVKVFRMLAARNGKLSEHIGTRTSPILKTDCPKDKLRGNCRYCKRPEDFPDGGDEFENGLAHSEECFEGNRRGQEAGPMINGKVKGRSNDSISFIESYAESFYESGQNFKKNLTSSKGLNVPAADKFSKRKDQKPGCKSCQRTIIRLEAGRIHVNVCHRVADANRNRPENGVAQPQKPAY